MSWTVSASRLSPFASPFNPKNSPESFEGDAKCLPADLLAEISSSPSSSLPLSPNISYDGSSPATPLVHRTVQVASEALPSIRLGQGVLRSQPSSPLRPADQSDGPSLRRRIIPSSQPALPSMEPSMRRIVPESRRFYGCLSLDKGSRQTQEEWVSNMMSKFKGNGGECSSLESIARYYQEQMRLFYSLNQLQESPGCLTQLICSEVEQHRSLSRQEFDQLWEMLIPCDYLLSGGWLQKVQKNPGSLEEIFAEILRAPKDPLFSLDKEVNKTRVYQLLREACSL